MAAEPRRAGGGVPQPAAGRRAVHVRVDRRADPEGPRGRPDGERARPDRGRGQRRRAREVLGLDVASAEDGAGWLAFLRGLVARGLSGVASGHLRRPPPGWSTRSARRCPGAAWQRCRTHYLRNLLTRVPEVGAAVGATLVRTIFDQPDADLGRAPSSPGSSTRSTAKFPDAAEHLDARPRRTCSPSPAFPREVWRQIWSNNPQERLNKEIRRRTDVVGIFPDRAAIIRLVGAVLAEQTDEWTEHAATWAWKSSPKPDRQRLQPHRRRWCRQPRSALNVSSRRTRGGHPHPPRPWTQPLPECNHASLAHNKQRVPAEAGEHYWRSFRGKLLIRCTVRKPRAPAGRSLPPSGRGFEPHPPHRVVTGRRATRPAGPSGTSPARTGRVPGARLRPHQAVQLQRAGLLQSVVSS